MSGAVMVDGRLRCGRPRREDGRPCMVLVGKDGGPCGLHGGRGEIRRCGVRLDSGRRCRVRVRFPGTCSRHAHKVQGIVSDWSEVNTIG